VKGMNLGKIVEDFKKKNKFLPVFEMKPDPD